MGCPQDSPPANPIRRGAYVPWELEWSPPTDAVAAALSWAHVLNRYARGLGQPPCPARLGGPASVALHTPSSLAYWGHDEAELACCGLFLASLAQSCGSVTAFHYSTVILSASRYTHMLAHTPRFTRNRQAGATRGLRCGLADRGGVKAVTNAWRSPTEELVSMGRSASVQPESVSSSRPMDGFFCPPIRGVSIVLRRNRSLQCCHC